MPQDDVRGLSLDESFARLVDLLPVPILVSQVIPAGDHFRDRTRHVNRRFREVIGYTLEDFHDIDSWAVLAYPDPAYREEVIGRWNRSVAESRIAGHAFTSVTAGIRCRDGRERWFEVVAEIESTVRAEQHVIAFLDVTRIHDAMVELETLSRTDPLTGILNRRAMLQRLDEEVLRARRTGRTFALVMCDIDDFKRVNDTQGHQVGDAVIRGVASVLAKGLRETDVVARWGGEEFCILLSETEGAGAWTLVHRVRDTLVQTRMPGGASGLSVTATFGIALHEPGGSIDDILRKADAALYSGKGTGKNCVVIHPGEGRPGSSRPGGG